ncbi:MAG: glutaredoxin family protein [Acidobacteria bacterium]|nr:glutaredoxin family protein [Acidobacteriota bacterium]
MVIIEFYTRKGCHLCETAEAELRTLQREKPFTLRIHDIDEDEELRDLYNVLVPATVLPDGAELHYRIDSARIKAQL